MTPPAAIARRAGGPPRAARRAELRSQRERSHPGRPARHATPEQRPCVRPHNSIVNRPKRAHKRAGHEAGAARVHHAARR